MNHRPTADGSPSRFRSAAAGLLAAGRLAAVGLLLALVWGASSQQAATTDAQMRGRVTRHAVEIARIVDPALARQLTFTAEDGGAPAYEIIREQMTALGTDFPNRGIRSMVLREGKLLFGPETYPAKDPWARSPGAVYQEPSAEAQDVFRTGRPATVGPHTDEFGTLVTAYAPVLDPRSGEVILVIGVDILAGDWQAELTPLAGDRSWWRSACSWRSWRAWPPSDGGTGAGPRPT